MEEDKDQVIQGLREQVLEHERKFDAIVTRFNSIKAAELAKQKQAFAAISAKQKAFFVKQKAKLDQAVNQIKFLQGKRVELESSLEESRQRCARAEQQVTTQRTRLSALTSQIHSAEQGTESAKSALHSELEERDAALEEANATIASLRERVEQQSHLEELKSELLVYIECPNAAPELFDELTATPVGFSDPVFQWSRSYAGSSFLPIPSAAYSTYTVCADDIGAVVRVSVCSYSNPTLSTSVESRPCVLNQESTELIQDRVKLCTKKVLDLAVTPLKPLVDMSKMKSAPEYWISCNKEKIKIKVKKQTLFKEKWNEHVAVELDYDNPLLFTLHLTEKLSFVLSSDTPTHRDELAITIRALSISYQNVETHMYSLVSRANLLNRKELRQERPDHLGVAIGQFHDNKSVSELTVHHSETQTEVDKSHHEVKGDIEYDSEGYIITNNTGFDDPDTHGFSDDEDDDVDKMKPIVISPPRELASIHDLRNATSDFIAPPASLSRSHKSPRKTVKGKKKKRLAGLKIQLIEKVSCTMSSVDGSVDSLGIVGTVQFNLSGCSEPVSFAMENQRPVAKLVTNPKLISRIDSSTFILSPPAGISKDAWVPVAQYQVVQSEPPVTLVCTWDITDSTAELTIDVCLASYVAKVMKLSVMLAFRPNDAVMALEQSTPVAEFDGATRRMNWELPDLSPAAPMARATAKWRTDCEVIPSNIGVNFICTSYSVGALRFQLVPGSPYTIAEVSEDIRNLKFLCK